MSPSLNAGGESGRLRQLVLKHAREAFGGPDQIAREWQSLNFSAPPDWDGALREYDALLGVLSDAHVDVRLLPREDGTTLDSIYTRDAMVVTPAGMVACHMGKPVRRREPLAQAAAYPEWGIPLAGAILPPGCLEGGDVAWLDARTVVVGRGYRTNAEGIRQFQALLGPGVDCHVVPLPHWRGHGDVFHLMSILSPVAPDLAVVYSPLLSVPFREMLLERGIRLVEVPDAEFDTMGTNVLALSPRRCVMVAGNPMTRRRLESAGCEVLVYDGAEISLKGGGGPTCLTRPVRRDP